MEKSTIFLLNTVARACVGEEGGTGRKEEYLLSNLFIVIVIYCWLHIFNKGNQRYSWTKMF